MRPSSRKADEDRPGPRPRRKSTLAAPAGDARRTSPRVVAALVGGRSHLRGSRPEAPAGDSLADRGRDRVARLENVDGAVRGSPAQRTRRPTEMHARSISATMPPSWPTRSASQENYAEAERFSEVTEREGASDDLVVQVLWRSGRARVLAGRGSGSAAEALAREAVGLARADRLPRPPGSARARLALAAEAAHALAGARYGAAAPRAQGERVAARNEPRRRTTRQGGASQR